MTTRSFTLTIVTPARITEQEITHLRVKDQSGFLGILAGHDDLLTVLVPSLCLLRDAAGKEAFLAVDGGILSVRGNSVTLTSREVFAGEDAERLAGTIEATAHERAEAERALTDMLERIERSFIEQATALSR